MDAVSSAASTSAVIFDTIYKERLLEELSEKERLIRLKTTLKLVAQTLREEER